MQQFSQTLSDSETITAQATPSGRGGIAIVRLSGSRVRDIMRVVVGSELPPREAVFVPFRDSQGELLDEGVAIFFPGPHSFTGEDVLELQGHGGPVVVDSILQCLLSLGARLARPGEFSERAFLNGKMDLTQAESIADLIDASSRQAARSALRSLQGEFSKDIHGINEKIVQLRMFVEAAIDFTDEEIDFLADESVSETLSAILADLDTIQHKARQGSFLREGITVVIAGEPNVGKSSLLNCLSGREMAIVTDIPGTTRDVLRESILIDGMPLHIIDTAGLRESADVIEQEGIRRAYREIENADLILYVTDASRDITQPCPACLDKPVIIVRNKIDLKNETPSIQSWEGKKMISLSVKTGEGIELFRSLIKEEAGFQPLGEGLYLARRRHLDALAKSRSHVEKGLLQLRESGSAELAAEDLRQAHLALCEITGVFTSDDLLGRIFSSFCIGK
ncbi:tRNA modification GTPase MnmE [Aquicella siphonis]|uniref:tRNA modification GTPase MnmE n=1 Tax=Aquicella siphonis TaxID=254247 RepID=A0A5E4PKI8_9COXI|nr:tRNA uridine-5-carboxymethylaminomethyl(34) synthesis GTPase MnmE [Aquicella siphonis]VVC76927.1 tRNA modification GTPase MnmE [Aquicella siphonis]